MELHTIDAKHFLPAVENAGSPLYCVDFVNLCRGDPHIFYFSQKVLLILWLTALFLLVLPLVSMQCMHISMLN